MTAMEPQVKSPTRWEGASYAYEVCASEKVEGRNCGYANLRVHVVTDTLENAIALFRTAHPDAELHKVERRNFMGKNAVMIDPKVAS